MYLRRFIFKWIYHSSYSESENLCTWGRERREKNGGKWVTCLLYPHLFMLEVLGGWKVADQNLEAHDMLHSFYACAWVCVLVHECVHVCARACCMQVSRCVHLSIWVYQRYTSNYPWEVMTLKAWLWISSLESSPRWYMGEPQQDWHTTLI